MMTRTRLPKSTRTFIRKEKARLRKELLGPKALDEALKKLRERFGVTRAPSL